MKAIRKNRIELIRTLEDVYLKELLEDVVIDRFRYEVITRIRSMPEDYLAYSEDCPDKVSYAQKTENRYDGTRRVKTTLTRYIRRRLGMVNTISDDMLDKVYRSVFAERIKVAEADHFRVVSGNKITEAYEQGIGYQSCMTGHNSQKVSLYAENPERVSMVIYHNMARALLWNCDDGIRVMDRIYPNDGPHIDVMRAWADDNSIAWRCHNSLDNEDVGFSDKVSHIVTLKNDGDTYPYLDTFKYGYISGSKLVLCNYDDRDDYPLLFNQTDGEYKDRDARCCAGCGGDLDDDYSHYVEGTGDICESCYDDNYSYCERCEDDVPRDCIQSVTVRRGTEYWCDRCVERHGYECSCCGTVYSQNGVITETVDSERLFCEDCLDRLYYCEDCGNAYEYSESVALCEDDKLYYCEDCMPEAIEEEDIEAVV